VSGKSGPAGNPEVDIGRRNFLRGASLTGEGRKAMARLRRPLGPSPPWMSSLVEQDHCNSCDQACIHACEQHIIRIHPRGHSLAGYPWLDFSIAGCTFCGKCAAACPLEHAQDGPVPVLGRIHIEQARCLTWDGVFCMSCVSACRYRAMSLDKQRRLVVIGENCNGCGACVSACPVGVLTVHGSGEP
jgi:ferredoxin-type protein NapF